jgi:hypothetical protein
MPKLKMLPRLLLLSAGWLAVVVSIGFSSASYSALLLGEESKDLSWGPLLFRSLLFFHGAILILVSIFARDSFQGKPRRGPQSDKSESGVGRPALIYLSVLSVIALALRLWNLNSDLWIDEVLTLLDFVRLPIGQIVTSFPSQNQHMLYSILAHASTAAFGESAWSLRLPSVIFGIASIWAFFFLCKSVLGKREALIGSTLMTVSYHHIWFSQNARGYMGLLLFTVLATWCWLRALETNRSGWWAAYALAIVLGMWVHPTMAFVAAGQALIHLVLLIRPSLGDQGGLNVSLERRAGLKPFVAWMLSLTLTLQLYALALPEFFRIGFHEESKDSAWTNPLWVVTESLNSLRIGFAGMAVVICAGGLVLFGWFCLFRKNRRMAVLTLLPAILAGTTMLALGHNLWPRFFFFSMGFGLLIVIYGATQLPQVIGSYVKGLRDRQGLLAAAGIGFASLIVAASLITLPRNYVLPKQNFSGAKDYVDSHSLPNDQVVAAGLADIVYGRYFVPHWPVAKTGEELESIDRSHSMTWLVYTLPIELEAFRPDLWSVIQRDFEVVKIFPGTLNGGEVFVCRRRAGNEDKNESSRNYNAGENASVRKRAATIQR